MWHSAKWHLILSDVMLSVVNKQIMLMAPALNTIILVDQMSVGQMSVGQVTFDQKSRKDGEEEQMQLIQSYVGFCFCVAQLASCKLNGGFREKILFNSFLSRKKIKFI
jgi:hypothetical protein